MWYKDTCLDHKPDYDFAMKIIFLSDNTIRKFWDYHTFDKETLEEAVERAFANPYGNPKIPLSDDLGSLRYKRTVAQFYADLYFQKHKRWPSFTWIHTDFILGNL